MPTEHLDRVRPPLAAQADAEHGVRVPHEACEVGRHRLRIVDGRDAVQAHAAGLDFLQPQPDRSGRAENPFVDGVDAREHLPFPRDVAGRRLEVLASADVQEPVPVAAAELFSRQLFKELKRIGAGLAGCKEVRVDEGDQRGRIALAQYRGSFAPYLRLVGDETTETVVHGAVGVTGRQRGIRRRYRRWLFRVPNLRWNFRRADQPQPGEHGRRADEDVGCHGPGFTVDSMHAVLNVGPAAGTSGSRIRSRFGPAGSAVVIASLLAGQVAVKALSAEGPEVVIEGIEVTPASPGAETLCRLRATVSNGGSRAVYSFGFDVELNGQPLPVYENQLFLQVIEAGESEQIALYNFWTSESGRPAPADGRVEVLVRLREARWVEVSEVEEDGETVEVWTPVGDVAGLPQTVSVTLELK